MVKSTRGKNYQKDQKGPGDNEEQSDIESPKEKDRKRGDQIGQKLDAENPKNSKGGVRTPVKDLVSKITKEMDQTRQLGSTVTETHEEDLIYEDSDSQLEEKSHKRSIHDTRSSCESSDENVRKGSKRKKFPSTRFVQSESENEYGQTVTTPVFSDLSDVDGIQQKGRSSKDQFSPNQSNNNNKKRSKRKNFKKKRPVESSSSEDSSDSSSSSSSSSESDSDSERESSSHRARSRAKRGRRDRKKRRHRSGRSKSKHSRRRQRKEKDKESGGYLSEIQKLKAEIEMLKNDPCKADKGTKRKGNLKSVFLTPRKIRQPAKKNKVDAKAPTHVGAKKSQSDSTIYAQAVAVNNENQTVVGASPKLANRIAQDDQQRFNESMVTDFIKRIRLNDFAGTSEDQTRAGVRSEVVRPRRSDDVTDQLTDPVEQARIDAQETVLAAERYKATMAPTGKDPTQIGNELVQYQDPDDDFFHTTCHIDLTLRERIKKGEFVELEKLLRKKSKLSRDGDEQRLEIFNKDGRAFLAPSVDKDTKITGITRWDQAFRVYATIYSEANPTRAPEIWQYIDVVHRAARVFNWENVANYDYVFRQLMAANPSRKWSKTYTQMWNLNLCEPIARMGSPNGGTKATSGKKSGSGICWRYNKNKCKFGDNCHFEHRCKYCLVMGHPASKCFKKQGGRGGRSDRDQDREKWEEKDKRK